MIIIGNREDDYPNILSQEQPHKHLSPSCNAHVKIDVNGYNNTRNDNNSWKWTEAYSAHLTNIFEMVNNILIVPEKTSLLDDFQIALKTHWQNYVQWLSVFLYRDSLKNA